MPPRISIGLPVYNAEAFVDQTIASIVGQSYGDFELLISDNGSTDDTADICQAWARRDDRIVYVRHPRNQGAAWNFNYTFHATGGELFKWAAGDDVLAADFLKDCLAALDSDPQAVLSYPLSFTIDQNNQPVGYRLYPMPVGDKLSCRRFRSLICCNHSCLAVFGLIRRKVLAQTPLIGAFVGSDRVLLAQLGLRGRFVEIPRTLFFHREHPARSTRALPCLRQRLAWFAPHKGTQLSFPNWRMMVEYVKSAAVAPLEPSQRAICMLQLAPWLRKNWRSLVNDLLAVREHLRQGPPVAQAQVAAEMAQAAAA